MAQHDYQIDNSSGVNVRTDINAALAALVSQNSGPVEPTTTFPFMLWLDTGVSPVTLRERNAANTGWQTPSSLAGAVQTAGAQSMQGQLQIKDSTAQLVLNKQISGGGSYVFGTYLDSPRWAVALGDGGAEIGSNTGSNFGIYRYTDAGAFINAPFSIIRATGRVAIGNDLTVAGTIHGLAGGARSDAHGQQLVTAYVATLGSIGFNAYVNSAGNGWYNHGGGWAGVLGLNPSNGAWTISTTVVSSAFGAAIGFSTLFTLFQGGGAVLTAPVNANHGLVTSANGAEGLASHLGQLGSVYGAVGFQTGGNSWGFYTNASGFAAGAWNASDGRLKNVHGELSGPDALAAVRDVPVVAYEAKNDAARTMYGNSNDAGPANGFRAEDIEAIVPSAVRDVSIPKFDLVTRAALRGVPVPLKDTPEAASLMEGEVTLKAVNTYALVATLWSAVQELTARVEALEARP